MSVILFPHSWLPSSVIKHLVNIFGPLTVFRPWYLEEELLKDGYEDHEKVRVLYPKADHRPGKHFKALLSEFRNWIKYNHDRSYREIIKTGQQATVSDEALWDIRRMIKRMTDINHDYDEDMIFRWNLTLHLAADIERQRFEAERLLKELRTRNPLLKDSVETVEDVEELFGDLPDFDSDISVHESGLGPLIEAWFGLFGSYLDEHEIFITINKSFFDYVVDQVGNIAETVRDHAITMKIPILLSQDESKMQEIRDRLPELEKNPESILPEFDMLSRSFNERTPDDIQGDHFLISITQIKRMPDVRSVAEDHFTKKLAGKVMVLFKGPTVN